MNDPNYQPGGTIVYKSVSDARADFNNFGDGDGGNHDDGQSGVDEFCDALDEIHVTKYPPKKYWESGSWFFHSTTDFENWLNADKLKQIIPTTFRAVWDRLPDDVKNSLGIDEIERIELMDEPGNVGEYDGQILIHETRSGKLGWYLVASNRSAIVWG